METCVTFLACMRCVLLASSTGLGRAVRAKAIVLTATGFQMAVCARGVQMMTIIAAEAILAFMCQTMQPFCSLPILTFAFILDALRRSFAEGVLLREVPSNIARLAQ